MTVVSGMALGIDGAAHRGALQGGGKYRGGSGLGLSGGLPWIPPVPLSGNRRTGAAGVRVSSAMKPRCPITSQSETGSSPLWPGPWWWWRPGKRAGLSSPWTTAWTWVGTSSPPRGPSRIPRPREAMPSFGMGPGWSRILRESWRSSRTWAVRRGTMQGGLRFRGRGTRGSLGASDTLVRPFAEPGGRGRGGRPGGDPVTQALAGLSTLELGGWARRCPGMRFQRARSQSES